MIARWQIVDKTIMEADQDRDGKISFEEFTKMVENTDVSMSMTLGMIPLPQLLAATPGRRSGRAENVYHKHEWTNNTDSCDRSILMDTQM